MFSMGVERWRQRRSLRRGGEAKMLWANIAVCRQQREMNDVLQLTNVAGPGVTEQRSTRLQRQHRRPDAQLLAVLGKKMLGQRHDVAAPFTQRRQVEGRRR